MLGSSGWVEADASAESTSEGFIALAGHEIPSGKTGRFMTRGYAHVSTQRIGGTIATGSALYLATSSGFFTTTPPITTNHVVRKVGYVLQPTGSDAFIYFNPSMDYLVLS